MNHFTFESPEFEVVHAHGGSAPIRFRRVLDRSRGFSGNFLDLSIIPAGADVGVHTHSADDEEIYVVVSGHGRMRLEDEEFEVGPGSVVVNRPGGTHGLRNIGDTDLRMVVVEIAVSESESRAS